MSAIYFEKGNGPTALNYAPRSRKLSQQYGLKEQIGDANLKLSALYEKARDIDESFNYYSVHICTGTASITSSLFRKWPICVCRL
ncbi:MAG: hypothetical protein ABIQ31_23090 [Ferruginibacter sp.]